MSPWGFNSRLCDCLIALQSNWVSKGRHKRYELVAQFGCSQTIDSWLDQNKVKIDHNIEYDICF